MKEKIQAALDVLSSCKAEFKEWVKDKSIPLDERWKLFIDSKLGDRKGYYQSFKNFNSNDYYDKFYWDRHMTIEVDDMYERGCEDNFEYFGSPEKANEFREDVLNKFIYSFNNDW